MKIVQFIFPFLFVRNWYDGSWEFSRARFILVAASIFLILVGLVIAHILQASVTYSSTTL
ncbi:MAG: hypothetical protein K9M10_03610 [Candidatus Pacebacteria bacterium]|nr:hypothetical protein [Candidatus Paceibacterota bacterium]